MSARDVNPFVKQYLMTAGPTPLPPAVSQVMAEPIRYHRAPAFVEVYARVLERLPEIFQTRNQVLCFAASGTGAMESAVANLIGPGDPAVVASCGKFGQRWAQLCDAYGAETGHLEVEWGEKVDPAALDEFISRQDKAPRAVYVTQSETSTGVAQRHQGPERGRALARRRPLRRRRLRPRRRRPPAGRVGRRRRRLGLAEVADVPARPRLRLGLRARDGARRREGRAAATTSTGRRPRRARRRTRRTPPSRPPSPSSWPSTSPSG